MSVLLVYCCCFFFLFFLTGEGEGEGISAGLLPFKVQSMQEVFLELIIAEIIV